MLPPARSQDESILVLVRSKGHVLRFHGGGTAPFTQINDTHLHSLLARLLAQLENDFAVRKRRVDPARDVVETPEPTREEIVQTVQCA